MLDLSCPIIGYRPFKLIIVYKKKKDANVNVQNVYIIWLNNSNLMSMWF